MQYDNNMKGVLWVNKKRQKETQPQMTGQCEINGVEYWVSAWTNKTQTGEVMQKLSFTEKEQQPQKTKATGIDANFQEDAIKSATDDLDAGMPF